MPQQGYAQPCWLTRYKGGATCIAPCECLLLCNISVSSADSPSCNHAGGQYLLWWTIRQCKVPVTCCIRDCEQSDRRYDHGHNHNSSRSQAPLSPAQGRYVCSKTAGESETDNRANDNMQRINIHATLSSLSAIKNQRVQYGMQGDQHML